MFDTQIAIVAALVLAAVGVIFTATPLRSVISKWQRNNELDALNHNQTVIAMQRQNELAAIGHAQTVAGLTEIGTQANQGANILPSSSSFESTESQRSGGRADNGQSGTGGSH